MKTKLFLLLIIAGLSSYIIYLQTSHATHEEIVLSSSQSDDINSELVDKSRLSNDVNTTQQASGSSLHSHDGSSHTHSHSGGSTSEESQLASEHHHVIPSHIKQNLCIDDNDPAFCTVDLEKDLGEALLDQSGNLLADEITTVLDSKNFQDVKEALLTKKESNEAYLREDDYQHQLNQLSYELNINSSKLYCSETICAMTLEYQEPQSSKTFFEKFFNKSDKGNIFVSQNYSEERNFFFEKIMFFPGNKNSVIVPEA